MIEAGHFQEVTKVLEQLNHKSLEPGAADATGKSPP